MKVDKTDFNKLKQLDRIEYLLKKDRIEKNNKYSMPSGLWFIALIILQTIFMMLWFIAFRNFDQILFELSFFRIGLFLLVGAYLVDWAFYIMFSIRQNKEEKELFNDYFKIEVKN